jgi:hypothetical protein
MTETNPDRIAGNPETGGNEIGTWGKVVAGFLLLVFTLAPIYIIIAYWPDRMATAKEDIKPLYINERFHVRLACIPDSLCCIDTIIVNSVYPDTVKHSGGDSLPPGMAAGPGIAVGTGGGAGTVPARAKPTYTVKKHRYTVKDLIHINILLLILVAAAGFAGNMIYITTSLTTFVGAGKFKKSWILWYCLKPFTASGLALGMYFVFRGGFLNMSDDSANINIYGVITLSLLTGLYTDRATMKLKEVINSLFGIKENDDSRPNKLKGDQSAVVTEQKPVAPVVVAPVQKPDEPVVPKPNANEPVALVQTTGGAAASTPNEKIVAAQTDINTSVSSVIPALIEKEKANVILINGTGLDQQKLVITMQGLPVSTSTITSTGIFVHYTLPDSLAALTAVMLEVKDEAGKEYYSGSIRVI